MVVPEANNPRTSTDLTHQRNRGHARALANNPKATDTTQHRATRVLQRNRPTADIYPRPSKLSLGGAFDRYGLSRSRKADIEAAESGAKRGDAPPALPRHGMLSTRVDSRSGEPGVPT